jgi:hypothetical protein
VDLEAVFRWSVENGLGFNSEKTQAMIICRNMVVLVDARTVPYSASVKNLGFTMDNRFLWRDQVSCVKRNVGCSISCNLPFFILCPYLFVCFGGGQ